MCAELACACFSRGRDPIEHDFGGAAACAKECSIVQSVVPKVREIEGGSLPLLIRAPLEIPSLGKSIGDWVRLDRRAAFDTE